MTSPTTPRRSSRPGARPTCAFTLVELLLVMALLAIVMAIGLPSLANFFKGRALDSEARRLLSLSRQAQSRAVSEGIPMLLWVDSDGRSYGLEAEPGWDEKDPRAVECKLDKELKVEAVVTNTPARQLVMDLQPVAATASQTLSRNLPRIRFLPDGSIDEMSPETVKLTDAQGSSLTLGLARSRLNYEIRKNQTEPK